MNTAGYGRGIDGSSLIATAQYHSIRGGYEKYISLVDAVLPLLGQSSHQLLLSSSPISVPWPLAEDDRPATDSNMDQAKRKRTEDEVSSQMVQLRELLEVDIPRALERLQDTLRLHDNNWLTLSKVGRVVLAKTDRHSRGMSVDWISMEAQREAKQLESDTSDALLSVSPASIMAANRMIHRLVVNESYSEALIACNSKESSLVHVFMPPKSAFFLANILRSQLKPPRGWEQLLSFAEKHPPNLILLDPPYPNYSAKRLKRKQETYDTVDDLYDLWKMKMPVQQLLQRGSKEEEAGVLVGCWVTNHAKVQRFILTKLFPEWGLHHVGQLVWVKITAGDASKSIAGGQLVFPLNNKQGRMPYEVLFLGYSKKVTLKSQTNLFASVPLGHSRKPSVLDVLRPLLSHSRQVNVYEFFARSLLAGPTSEGYWVSIGNEPFTFSQERVRDHVNEEAEGV